MELHWGAFVGAYVGYSLLSGLSQVPDYVTDKKDRVKWSHMVSSIVHAFVASSLALWYILGRYNTENSVTLLSGLDGHNWIITSYCAGFFIYDTVVCVKLVKVYGLGMILHALISLFAMFSGLYYEVFVHFTVLVTFFEASTVFLHSYWFGKRLGVNARLLSIFRLLFPLSFFLVRIVFGFYQWLLIAICMYKHSEALSTGLMVAGLGAELLMAIMNFAFAKGDFPSKAKTK